MNEISRRLRFISGQFDRCSSGIWKGRFFRAQLPLSSDQLFNELSPRMKKFKLQQAYFQKPDDVPVFLKAGPRDKILYYSTLAIFFYGSYLCVKSLIDFDDMSKN